MQKLRFLFCALCLMAGGINLLAQDSTAQQRLSGYVMTEMNYGHRHGQAHPTLTDFPHILANATLALGKGWSAVAEVEYERFRDEGAWGNNFRNDYTTNKLYINKKWNEALNVKAGIIDIPVGTTNSGGPALTIYDPLSESTLMPMSWHEGGAAVWGRINRVHYEVGAYVYATAPLKDSRVFGTAVRVGCEPLKGLDLSLSGFYSCSKEGLEQHESTSLMDYDHIYHAAFDFAYLANGWTIDGQLIASNAQDCKAAGLEAGYDVAAWLGLPSCSVIPFTRYDGYFHFNNVFCNKWTAGLNTSLPLGFTFKAEAAWMNPSNTNHTTMVDISIGWQHEF